MNKQTANQALRIALDALETILEEINDPERRDRDKLASIGDLAQEAWDELRELTSEGEAQS
jgi:hypothetical protein